MKTHTQLPAPHRTGHAGSFPALTLKSGLGMFLASDGGGSLDAPETVASSSVSQHWNQPAGAPLQLFDSTRRSGWEYAL